MKYDDLKAQLELVVSTYSSDLEASTERELILSHTRQGTNGLLNFILSSQYVRIDRWMVGHGHLRNVYIYFITLFYLIFFILL
jgi:hypothetical protein